MKITPRPYQQRAIDSAINWMKKNTDSCVLDLSMSAGKSIIASFIAYEMNKISGGKKVLVLCPNATLVAQNAEKYAMLSDDYSIYSASISKSLRHDVVFATPMSFISVANDVENFCCVVVDEGDSITKTVKEIINILKGKNPLLRVCSMTGTPYRTGEGWIAEIDVNNSIIEEAVNPYYKKIVARVSPHELIELGYATPPLLVPVFEKYDTQNLKLNSSNKFNQSDLDEVFIGQGRKTASIVGDIVNHSNRINARGVMIFATSIEHCNEVMESLPNYNSGVINGQMGDAHNKRTIQQFRDQKIRYLVNVNMATVGFSVDHVDILAILRPTESSRLYQQILGRGMRLDPHKKEFLLLDYTDNIANLFPSGDVFTPEIVAYGKKPTVKMDFVCPLCNSVNNFSLRPNPDHMAFNQEGYFIDLDGEVMLPKTPAHYGRRCTHIHEYGKNRFERCTNFWECKICESCGQDNDIAARKCSQCKKLLIDYNDKLIGNPVDKNDLTQIQTDRINRFYKKATTSKAGNEMLRVNFKTEYRDFVAFFSSRVNRKFYEMLQDKNFKPETVSYKKKGDFFAVVDFNRKADIV